MQKTDRNHIRPSVGDKTLTVSVILITALFALVVFIPLWNIVVSSFSDVNAVLGGRVSLWPVDFSLDGYKAVLSNKDVGTGYLNTLAYTVIGTIVNISVTMICAYPLTRRELPFRGLIMFLFTFTMFFGGGLIASYLNISNLHMINTFWVMILPGAMSVYNMVLARTFIQSSIPNDLMEAARIDGCSYTRYFFKIVLPLSPAILAVLALNYAVGHWNLPAGSISLSAAALPERNSHREHNRRLPARGSRVKRDQAGSGRRAQIRFDCNFHPARALLLSVRAEILHAGNHDRLPEGIVPCAETALY